MPLVTLYPGRLVVAFDTPASTVSTVIGDVLKVSWLFTFTLVGVRYAQIAGVNTPVSARVTAREPGPANEITVNKAQAARLRHHYGAVPYCCAPVQG